MAQARQDLDGGSKENVAKKFRGKARVLGKKVWVVVVMGKVMDLEKRVWTGVVKQGFNWVVFGG